MGVRTGFPLWGMILFSLPFLGAGLWVLAMGSGWVQVNSSDVHAPLWVLQVFGLCFFGGGCMVLLMAGRQVSLQKRIRQQQRNFPNEPAYRDYPWDPSGFSPPRWKPVLSAWAMALFMSVFLSMFNWWAFFSDDGPLMVKVIVGLFDLILLWVWWHAFSTLLHAVKFGRTRLVFPEFPVHPGQWLKAVVELPPSLTGMESAEMTLRCIREFWETRGTGRNRSKSIVHEQIWAESQQWSGYELGAWPGKIQTTFILPADAPGTCLSEEIPIFWELEVRAEVPGVDLTQRYLVPVYRGPDRGNATSGAPAGA